MKILFFILLAFCGQLLAATWPVLEAPPLSRVATVGEDMTFNGVPMQARQFVSDLSPEKVLQHYRNLWGEGKDRSVENKVGKWQVIGKRDGHYYLTVQVKPGVTGKSEGLLGLSMLPQAKIIRKEFLMPAGSKILSDLGSKDGPNVGRNIVLANHHSPQVNANFFKERFVAEQWKMDSGYGKQLTEKSQALFFTRGKDYAVLTIAKRNSETVVIVNVVAQQEGL